MTRVPRKVSKPVEQTDTQAAPDERVVADRRCARCRETKPIAAFHRHGARGHHYRCKACIAATRPSQAGLSKRADRSGWRQPTPEERRARKLAAQYGITLEQERLLLASQRGACAICGKAPKPDQRLAVDHCHVTGRVRAMLCLGCNTQLGAYENFRDQAASYLAKYGEGSALLGYT